MDTRLIAFYLPQYHPIPENDVWWGRGFTEWTNVTRAKPLFRGHYQPHIPADLGFYDLRVPEVREAQAALARAYGIDGFCYYHYWFNGQRLLDRPFNEVLRTGKPDFPFMLCWANENWTRIWDGGSNEVLLRQQYSSEDDLNHIHYLCEVFTDPRYIKVANRPIFLVYSTAEFPNVRATIDRWRNEALRLGIGELLLCRVESSMERGDPRDLGFDAAVAFQPKVELLGDPIRNRRVDYWLRRIGLAEEAYFTNQVYDYETYVERLIAEPSPPYPRYPCTLHSFDNSARRIGRRARIIKGTTPKVYERSLINSIRKAPSILGDSPIVFINAWNEWAEGNHLEPCRRWGHAFLEATHKAKKIAGNDTW